MATPVGKVLSVNVGSVREFEYGGRPARSAIWKSPAVGRIAARGVNLAGDDQADGKAHVLEGEYELGLDDQPTKVLKAGETFYEATGCLHRVSKNPAAKGNTRVLAVVLHPRDARQITIPEPKK